MSDEAQRATVSRRIRMEVQHRMRMAEGERSTLAASAELGRRSAERLAVAAERYRRDRPDLARKLAEEAGTKLRWALWCEQEIAREAGRAS